MRRRVRRGSLVDLADPVRPASGDRERLTRIALRRDAAHDHARGQSVGARRDRRVDFPDLTAQVQALAAHACAVGQRPRPGIAVLAARRDDDEMTRARRRPGQLGHGHLRGRRCRSQQADDQRGTKLSCHGVSCLMQTDYTGGTGGQVYNTHSTCVILVNLRRSE